VLVPDYCEDEKARLLRRTEELRALIRSIAPDQRPSEHSDLQEQLAQHHRDLIAFLRRCSNWRF
jgi:hypothetical protein